MPVMDEFKEERAAIKNGTPKEKLSYFIEYYKWHVIIAVAVICFIVSMIYNAVTRKETAFYAAMINAVEIASSEEHLQSFAEFAEIDQDEYDLLFDSSMRINSASLDQETISSSQKLMTYIAAGEIDVLVTDAPTLEQYAYNDSFFDLREILTSEQLERYGSYLYYIDAAVVRALDAALDESDYDYKAAVEYPDPRHPADMDEPVPIGICLDDAESFHEIFFFTGGDSVLSIPLTSSHPENAAKYIDFLLQQ